MLSLAMDIVVTLGAPIPSDPQGMEEMMVTLIDQMGTEFSAGVLVLVLVEFVLLTIIAMLNWFAIPLVLEGEWSVRQSLEKSFIGCQKNWLPLSINVLLFAVLLLLAALPLGLGLLVVLPMLFGSYYHSYQDIFHIHRTDESDD